MEKIIFVLSLYIILSIFLSKFLKLLYYKYSKLFISINNKELINEILIDNNINNITINQTSIPLSDNYNIKTKTIYITNQSNISQLAISLHECGHVLQDFNNYFPLKIRNAIFYIFNIFKLITAFLIIIGLLTNLFILKLGMLFFVVALFYQFLIVLIEIDASKRAVEIIKTKKIVKNNNLKKIKIIYNISAISYFFSMFNNLLYIGFKIK